MTRYTSRAFKKTHVEATPWNELIASAPLPQPGVSEEKRRKDKQARKSQSSESASAGPSPVAKHARVGKASAKAKHSSSADAQPGTEGTESVRPEETHSESVVSAAKAEKAAQKALGIGLTLSDDSNSLFGGPKAADILAALTNQASGQSQKRDGGRSEAGEAASQPSRRQKDQEMRRSRRANSKKICFKCRKMGHAVSECRMNAASTATGICYVCGSPEHTTKTCKEPNPRGEFPFALCFVCKQTGHLSRNCPQNTKGLYPDGGACKFCGGVDHLAKDCPDHPKKKSFNREITITQSTPTADPEDDGMHVASTSSSQASAAASARPAPKKVKVVKF